MENLKYVLGTLALGGLAFLFLSHATSLIYLVCTVVAAGSLVVYVLIYYQRYVDDQNEPQKIVVEGHHTFPGNEFEIHRYQQQLGLLRGYFENRYLAQQAKIVYLLEKEAVGWAHHIYISTEDEEAFLKIKSAVGFIFQDEKADFHRGLPTI